MNHSNVNTAPAITIANDDTLSALVLRARRRLVILAPALSNEVAASVEVQWRRLGANAVSVVLDVDAEVYRLGYGDADALTRLERAAAELGTTLNRQLGIRIGIVIADDETLVYSPTPLLIEAGPRRGSAPNAIRLVSPPANVERELGRGPDGNKEQTIGLDKADKSRIAQVQQNLATNPPQKFDVARSVRVFNAAFEFVDFELAGTFIDRKTVPIPKHLSGVGDKQTQEQLRTSFRILPPDHKLSGEHLQKDKALIAKKYLRMITGYGNVVLRSRKAEFEKDVEKLRADVQAFAAQVKGQLQGEMDKNRDALFKAFLPHIKRRPPQQWCSSDGTKPDADTLRQFLHDELTRAFGTADQLIKQMEVTVVYKGVTFELLTNEKFLAVARNAVPELSKLYDEFDAAKAVDASTPAQNVA